MTVRYNVSDRTLLDSGHVRTKNRVHARSVAGTLRLAPRDNVFVHAQRDRQCGSGMHDGGVGEEAPGEVG